MYDVKTVAVNAQVRQSYTQIAAENPQIYAKGLLSPTTSGPERVLLDTPNRSPVE